MVNPHCHEAFFETPFKFNYQLDIDTPFDNHVTIIPLPWVLCPHESRQKVIRSQSPENQPRERLKAAVQLRFFIPTCTHAKF